MLILGERYGHLEPDRLPGGAATYRSAGSAKAVPGFDVIDYGQEDYVFGSKDKDARHWNTYLLDVFQEHADTLSSLFNLGASVQSDDSQSGSSSQSSGSYE